MTKEELLGKEMSNLYAISKQVNTYFNGSDIRFLSPSSVQVLEEYVKFSCKQEEETANTLRAMEVNPGNTTDSIVNEITENLNETASLPDIKNEVKDLGYMLSLHRLMSYHKANIENLQHLVEEVYKVKS